MIAAPVNVKALSTFLGHASITMTLDRYGHLLPGSIAEATSLLDTFLARAEADHRLSAFLIAGATKAEWTSALGSELFAGDEWLMTDLLERYAKHWSFWRNDVKTRPLRLPEVVRTAPIAAAEAMPGVEIRCVEVHVPTSDWIEVP